MTIRRWLRSSEGGWMDIAPTLQGVPVEPGQVYAFSGGFSGGKVDAVFIKPDGQRWERDISMPYIAIPREGETHVQFVFRAAEVSE